MAKNGRNKGWALPILIISLILILSLAIIPAENLTPESRANPDIMFSIAKENHEIALNAVSGPPTLENTLLQGRAFAIACEIAYMGKQLEKYIKSREVACDTLLLFNANCWVDCDR